ncbi:hypothetical protein Tco_0080697, partial [Tanacetum coccineum]
MVKICDGCQAETGNRHENLKDRSVQNEVNDIRSERLARSANPLALLAAAQPYGAPFLNVQKTFDHSSSSLGYQCLMMSDHNSSDLAPQRQNGLVLHQMTSDHNRSELGIHDHSNEPSSSKLVPKVVPLAVKTATSRQELELLFHHHIAMLRTT